jgi:hypothetical protein
MLLTAARSQRALCTFSERRRSRSSKALLALQDAARREEHAGSDLLAALRG